MYNYRLDGYGHVNNARYLEFLEEARWDFFRKLGVLAQLRDVQLVVSRVDIRYRAAAVLDDVLDVHSCVRSVQSRQLVLAQQIVHAEKGTLLAEAEVSLMPTCAGRITRLDAAVLAEMMRLMENT